MGPRFWEGVVAARWGVTTVWVTGASIDLVHNACSGSLVSLAMSPLRLFISL